MLRRVADVAQEPVAPVVEGVAEPGPTRDRFEPTRPRVESKVTAKEVDHRRPCLLDGHDLAAVARACAVDPVVQAPLEVVHDGLDIVLAEPSEDLPPLVGAMVAVM